MWAILRVCSADPLRINRSPETYTKARRRRRRKKQNRSLCGSFRQRTRDERDSEPSQVLEKVKAISALGNPLSCMCARHDEMWDSLCSSTDQKVTSGNELNSFSFWLANLVVKQKRQKKSPKNFFFFKRATNCEVF